MPSMEHDNAHDELIYIIEQMEFLSPEREDHLKNLVTDVWNEGYDKAISNHHQLHRNMGSGTREDLQDQIDDLQQQVGELQFAIAELKEKSDCPGGKLQVGDTQLPVKSRFYVEFDRIENDPTDGPRTYRDFMVVFATNKWYAENKVRIAYPYPQEKNFETFLLTKQEA